MLIAYNGHKSALKITELWLPALLRLSAKLDAECAWSPSLRSFIKLTDIKGRPNGFMKVGRASNHNKQTTCRRAAQSDAIERRVVAAHNGCSRMGRLAIDIKTKLIHLSGDAIASRTRERAAKSGLRHDQHFGRR